MAEIIKTVIDVDINTSGAAAELRSLQQQINAFNLTLNKGQLEQGQASRVFAEGLRNSINTGGFFRAELVKMQTAAGALDSTLRKGQGTLGQFFSASFNKKGGMAAEVFALASERARTMQTQFIATGKASKGMQEALSVRPLTAFSADAAVSAQRMQILNSMFKQGTTGLINFGKNVQWTGRQLMVGFTIPLTIFGTTAGKVFSDLERQAVNFKKVYGDIFTTPAELEENFKAVQGLSKEFTKYGIAAKDTMRLASEAAAAGRQNAELTDAVRESTRLATLGQMDQNQALETTIALQSAFKLSGEELTDTINFLNMVENQTVVNLQDLAAAIPRVAPVIKGLGGDVKDLSVFLAAMQEGGVSAEQGANALKSGLASLINPTNSAKKALEGFKINLDSIIQTNRGDLMGTVMAFSQALSTLDDFSKQQALEQVFGKFQYARLGALFENISREGSQAQQVISTLGYSTEQLAKSAEKELSTVEQAFSVQLTGAIERLKIAIAPIGEIFVKMAIPIVNMVTKMIESFNRLPESVKNVATLAAALGGVLLPVATMLFGLFANLIGTFAKFSHSMGMFGVTLVRKGPLAAIKSLTQSANYLSLSEIDAANAARQLGSATEIANAALLSQVGSANSADVAIKNLTNSYRVLISEQTRASQVQPFLFGTGQAASNLGKGSAAASVAATVATRGKSRIKAVGLNQGGSVFTPENSNTVPGVGNTDTVPAMLTPGEFVVNKESTQKNLGLLHAINDSQKLNIGGKVKNGIQYAMAGFRIGNIPGYSAATNTVAAKLARTGQAAVTRTRGATPRTPGEAVQLKNNFVYLLNPTNNQQLTGVRTMRGFDKRGVPLDVLKQDMVSEDGLWMIDALAKGNWKKDAYRSTLENNFSNIANKYSGKEIRFLDSAGLERVQPLLGKPEYQNVQFVSVKDLQNKELLDNLTPDHIDRLMTDGTQVSRELKTSKSRGTTTLKDVYRGIPGMESYTKILTNWRGERKPRGKHGAHMYNGGGLVTDSDLILKAFSTGRGPANRVHSGRPTGIALDKTISGIWKKTAFDSKGNKQKSQTMIERRRILLEKNEVPKSLINKILRYKDPLKAAEILRQNNFGFYSTGFAGGTSVVSGRHYNMFTEELRKLADPPTGDGKPGPEASKNLAKKLPPHILEGSFPLTKDDFDNVMKNFEEYGKKIEEGEAKEEFNKLLKKMKPFKSLNKKQYERAVIDRMKKVQGSVGGKLSNIDWIFKKGKNGLPQNYTVEDVLDRIYDVDNPSFKAQETKGVIALKNEKTGIGKLPPGTRIMDLMAKVGKIIGRGPIGALAKTAVVMNKGGMIPGMQYANVGKIIAAMSKTKERNVLIDRLSYLSGEVKEKILSGQVKKRSDFTSRSDRALFDNSTNMALSNPSKDDLLDLLTTDHSNLLSNSHLYSIALNKNADDDVLNLLATQFKNRLRYAKPEELGNHLNQTAKIIQDRGIKLNKGGMIPGVQYAMSGKLITDAMKTGKFGEKLGQYSKEVVDTFQQWINTPAGNLGTVKGAIGKDPRITSLFKSGFKRSSRAEVLERASWLPFVPVPGQKMSLGSLSSFSPKGVGVEQHLAANPAFGQLQVERYMKKQHSMYLERSKDALIKKRKGEFVRQSEEEILKDIATHEDMVSRSSKAISDIESKNKPTIIELSTPQGTIRANVDEIVPKGKQEFTQYGKTSSVLEQERILHNAMIEVLDVKNEDGIFKIIAKLLSSEMPEMSTISKFNRGSIVPGVGNTDTVPAMLTPGEFVINKESTKQNYDLLTAINSGKAIGLNKGGIMPEVQYFAKNKKERVVQPRVGGVAGAIVGTAASIPFFGMTEEMGMAGSMIAGMAAYSVANKAAVAAMLKLKGQAITTSKLFPMLSGSMTSLSAVLAKAGIAISAGMLSAIAGIAVVAIGLGVALQKMKDNAINSGAKLSDAMFGSAKSLENMAKAFDRTTPGREILQQQAEQAAGTKVSEETKVKSSQFIESDAGKQMIKDLAFVKKMGEDQATALKNQLAQAVISGVITTEEAQQVAIDIGAALNDTNLAVNATGKLTELLGPDGVNIKNNRLNILAEISASTNEKDIANQVEKQRQIIEKAAINPFITGYDLELALQNLSGKLFGQESLDSAIQIRTLSNNIIENAIKEREIRAQITLEYQRGLLTFKEYKEQIDTLNLNQVGAQSSTQFFKDSEMAGKGLKLNVSGGADYAGSKGLIPFSPDILSGAVRQFDRFQKGISLRGIVSKLPGGARTAASQKDANLEGLNDLEVKESIDFINQVNDKFNEMLDGMNLTKAQKQKIQDFLTEEYEGSAEELNKLQMDIMSGRVSMASVAEAQRLTEYEPELVSRLESMGIGAMDATSKVEDIADPELRQRLIEKQAQPFSTGYVDQVVEGYNKLQGLPPEIIKTFRIDMGDEKEILEFAAKSDILIKQWNILSGLNPSLDKEVVFGLIAKDDEGNTYTDKEIMEKTKTINQAMVDLESTDSSVVRKAELSIFAAYNDMDPASSEAQQSLEKIKSAYKDWDSFSSGTKELLFKYNAQINDIDLAKTIIQKQVDGAKPGDPNLEVWKKELNALMAQRSALEGQIEGAVIQASVQPESKDSGTKSALQSAKDAARQTKEVIAAQSKLLAAGISLDALEGLSPEAIIDLSKKSGKELKNNIKLFNEQAETIKINKLALQELALEENPIKKALEDSKKTVEGYDDQIKELNKTIEKTNRANELDRRRIEDKNKALENLTKKEKNVNDQYNERIKALDKVANANDRVAERQRQQIDLATALTSGDIAGAAQAASAITQTGAQNQIEDTKTALEAQRQAELDGLTESVNGRLMSRKDIQAEIDAIEETIYQRNINLRFENDQIYALQQKINYEKGIQDDLNKVLEDREKVQVENAKKKLSFEEKITKQRKEQARTDFIAQLRKENPKITNSQINERLKDITFAFGGSVKKYAYGGMVKKYAYGGNVGYRGSTEAPPALKMARGSIVPGLGNTDRVPALLTPGEFVVRKSVAQANMPLLKALNSDVFPSMSLNTPDVAPTVTSSTSTILNNTPVYNYSISVNVPNTTASPDEIANVVVSRIKRSMDTNIRSNRY